MVGPRDLAERLGDLGVIGKCFAVTICPAYRRRIAFEIEVEETWARLRAVAGDAGAEALIPEIVARGRTLSALKSVYQDYIAGRLT